MANDFTKNPRGSNTGTVRPRDFLQQGMPQRPATPAGQDVNPTDSVGGGSDATADAGPGMASGSDVGVGTIGNSARPFRLGG